jgi:hypothetical protein
VEDSKKSTAMKKIQDRFATAEVLILSKLLYICYMLVVPAVILDHSYFVFLAGFLLARIGAGIMFMFTLLDKHSFLHHSTKKLLPSSASFILVKG